MTNLKKILVKYFKWKMKILSSHVSLIEFHVGSITIIWLFFYKILFWLEPFYSFFFYLLCLFKMWMIAALHNCLFLLAISNVCLLTNPPMPCHAPPIYKSLFNRLLTVFLQYILFVSNFPDFLSALCIQEISNTSL